jgi:two-component system, cell cycle sensor histidine kinase and response regulator CckA
VSGTDPGGFDRDHLAAIVESSEDAIVGKALDGTVRSWNPAAERIFGYTAEEMVGASIFRLIPPELHDEEHHIHQISLGQRLAHFETQRIRKDGRRVLISLTVSPIWNAQGELIGAASVKRDVTAQRNLEEQLRQAQKLEALGLLAGGVAHDFNNILTIIAGFTAFLSRAIPPESPAHPDLLGIENATERATQLTQQLLAFARHQTAQIEVIDLATIVNETAGLLRRVLGDHIRLEVRPSGGPVWVRADQGQISQILINLAVNARDAMVGGGTLTIAAFDDTAADRAILTVRDTGRGMDETTKARLFDRFFTTKESGAGTGLGLTTVASIVQAAGGRVEVDSSPGKGAVFRVSLPRARPDEPAETPAEKEIDVRGHETVLVVDDESGAAALAARTLLDYGYTVIQATGPGAAMVAFAERTSPVDLVVTDLVMPGLNGRALVEQLRVHEPKLAVLYVSGHADQLVGDMQSHVGDAPIIAKPFTPIQLARAVRRSLDDRGLPRKQNGGSKPDMKTNHNAH